MPDRVVIQYPEAKVPEYERQRTMGFFDPIRRQLRSVIEWDNPGEDELFRKWSENGDEIKNASKLIANP